MRQGAACPGSMPMLLGQPHPPPTGVGWVNRQLTCTAWIEAWHMRASVEAGLPAATGAATGGAGGAWPGAGAARIGSP